MLYNLPKKLNNDIKSVQILMGDSDQTMILKVYNSVRCEDVMAETAIKVLNGILKGKSGIEKSPAVVGRALCPAL